jgi:hypothetical protein
MTTGNRYGVERVFATIDNCPACHRDHVEQEFKLTQNGLMARCSRTGQRLKYMESNDGGIIRAVTLYADEQAG